MNKLIILSFLFAFTQSFAQNNALDFDGVDNYISVTTNPVLGNSARTVELWFNTSSASNQTLLQLGFGGGVPNRFTLVLTDAGRARIESGVQSFEGTTSFNDGGWHHYAVVYNPASTPEVRLFVDGSEEVNGDFTADLNTANSITIGAPTSLANYFDGQMDELRIWSVARTQSQVQAAMDLSFPTGTGLESSYNFNSGVIGANNAAFTTLNDNSGNLNNGTLNGFTLIGPTSNWVAGSPIDDAFVVTSTLDDGSVGTLRWCIDNANTLTGANIISFNIPGVGPWNIILVSNLPFISEPITIDGKSQTGWDFGAENMVTIDVDAISGGIGLDLRSANITVSGLRIHNAGTGISINGDYDNVLIEDNILNLIVGTAINVVNGDDLTIQGNHIGVSGDGLSNGSANGGIGAVASDNLQIGGDRSSNDGNMISGNAFSSYLINISSSTNLDIQGNVIGASLNGNDITVSSGIFINNTDDVLIGGPTADFRNYVNGIDQNNVVRVGNGDIIDISNNYIGVGTMDSHLIGNSSGNPVNGLVLLTVTNFTVDGNVISGSSSGGIDISGTSNLGSIINNRIGVAPDGTSAFGNTTQGINIVHNTVTNTTIGGVGNENIIANNNIGLRTALTSFGTIDVQENNISCNTIAGIDISGTPLVTSPTITSINPATIQGTSSEADGSIVRVYEVDPACADNQGALFVGQTTVASGSWSATGTFDHTQSFVATVHDITEGSSEFSSAASTRPFITTWIATGGEITIPTFSSGYNYSVYIENTMNAGDNQTLTAQTGSANITGLTDGDEYQIEITGMFPRIYFFGDVSERLKIQSVDQWGDIAWGSFGGAFYGCEDLVIANSDAPDLSLVADMSAMFQNATNFNSSIDHWQVSTIENMSNMFSNADAFTQDLNNWTPTSATDMSNMFSNCLLFNGNITTWDVSSVDDMSNMFFLASAFNQPIGSWGSTTNGVEDMGGMFWGATSFNQDISNWDVSTVDDMADMFRGATDFNNVDMPLTWGNTTASVENMSRMFFGATAFNQGIDDWEVSSVTTFSQMFEGAILFNQPLNDWTVTGALNMWRMFFNADAFTQDLNLWQPTSVTDMGGMFGSTALFNGNITTWNVSSVQDFSSMFINAAVFNQPIGNWSSTGNTGSADDMSYMFANAVAFDQPLNGWDVSMVTDMTNMFSGTDLFNQDISSWDVSSVISMQSMFNGSEAFNQDLLAWGVRVGMVSDFRNMFLSAAAFNQSLGSWDISAATAVDRLTGMLSGSNLSTANYDATLIGWEAQGLPSGVSLGAAGLTYCTGADARTSLAWSISDAGQECAFITIWLATGGSITIPTRSGETYNYDISWSNLTNPGTLEGSATVTSDVSYVIPGIEDGSTYQIEISGIFPRIYFNTGTEVDKILTVEQWGDIAWTSMANAFLDCSNLTIPAIDAPDLSGVTDMTSMLQGCTAFNNPVNHWVVDNVTDMQGLFSSCQIFNQDLDLWNVDIVTDMSGMFAGTDDFNGNISDWTVTSVTNFFNMFNGASSFDQPLNWTINTTPGAAIDMSAMFQDTPFNQDLNTWDMSEVVNTRSMFRSTTEFNGNIDNWNVSQVTDMLAMFGDAAEFDRDLSSWMVNSVTTMRNMFANTPVYNQDLSAWHDRIGNVSDMSFMFTGTALFNGNISNWDVSNVQNMQSMFDNAVAFNQDLSGWMLDDVNTIQGMFAGAALFNQDISGWNVSNISNMRFAFSGASAFNQNLGSWDIVLVTDMTGMLTNSGLSTANYDATLIGWADDNGGTETIPSNVNFDAFGLSYCTSQAAKDLLEGATYSWTMDDDGVDCSAAFEVTNTNDSGEGSLGWTIDNANLVSGTDNISFNISDADPNHSSGVWTISPSTDLPDITEAVILDATTQPGTENFKIVLDGGGTLAEGFNVADGGGGSEFYGFYITGFDIGIDLFYLGGQSIVGAPSKGNTIVNCTDGILGQLSDNHLIQGNYIGTDEVGTMGIGNGDGLAFVSGSSSNTIGGSGVGEQNVISGNTRGIYMNGASSSTIVGNYIGTDPSGLTATPNGTGVYIASTGSCQFVDNVVSGNTGAAFLFNNSNSNMFYGNRVGVGSDGSTPLANDIGFSAFGGLNVDNTIIGGLLVGQSNIIANNTTYGIDFGASNNYDGNVIIGNSVYCNGTGIRLNNVGNNNIQPPVINEVTTTTVGGTGVVGETIHVYRDNSGCSPADPQGQEYLGTAVVDGAGDWQVTGLTIVLGTDLVTATATNGTDGTSEFGSQDPYTVTNTLDANPTPPVGSLRWVINNANASTDPSVTISFNIGSAAPWVIQPVFLLPTIDNVGTVPIEIDGTTQPGWAFGNSLTMVHLEGSLASNNGLRIDEPNVEIYGLVIEGFQHGIRIDDDADGLIIGAPGKGNVSKGHTGTGIISGGVADNVTIQSNYIGTSVDGLSIDANSGSGISVEGDNILIGGNSTIGEGNVISNNGSSGLEYGIYTGTGDNIDIYGNLIGTDKDGENDFGNLRGIRVGSGASNVTIGGTGTGQRNVISGTFSAYSVHLQSLDNVIVDNNFIGLNSAGTTAIPNTRNGIDIDASGSGAIIRNNTIVASSEDGIYMEFETNDVIIENNMIGTTPTGLAGTGLGNRNGIAIRSSSGINNSTQPLMIRNNVIGASSQEGISVWGTGSGANIVIEDNLVGIAIDESAVPNTGSGIEVLHDDFTDLVIQGNTISANNIAGIYLDGTTGNHLIQNNNIGTTSLGTGAVLGNLHGILLNNATGSDNISNQIQLIGNTISGNGLTSADDGIDIGDGTSNVIIQSNKLGVEVNGTTPLGNLGAGINFSSLTSPTNILVGGVGFENIISNNGTEGIRFNTAPDPSIQIDINSYSCNGTAGIGFNGGSTVSTPLITSVSASAISGTSLEADGALIDVYEVDPSCADNQGYIYLGQTTVISNNWSYSTVTDISNEYTATVTNVTNGISEFATALGVDPPGNALHLDGSNDQVNIGNPAEVQITGNLTIEAWFKVDGPQSLFSTLAGKWSTGGSNASYTLGIYGGSLTFGLTSAGGDNQGIGSGSDHDDGLWHHAAGVWDGTTMRLYVDGCEVNSTTPTGFGTISNTTLDFIIGADASGQADRFFDGQIDEVRIWSEARSESDLRNNIFSELVGNETNLRAYYRFDESGATVILPDVTSNFNDGTFNGGTPQWVASGAFTEFIPKAATDLFTTEISATQIDLSWTDNAFNETGYTIERSDGNNDFTTPDATFVTTVDATTYSDVSVIAENGYFYRVIANGSPADSNPSNEKFGSTISPPGNALDFDGVDDYVEIPDNSDVDFGSGEFTFELWFKPNSLADGNRVLIGKDLSGERQFGMQFDRDFTGNNKNLSILFYRDDDSFSGLDSDANAITDLNWHHIAAVRRADNFEIYVDGILIKSGVNILGSVGGEMAASTSPIRIGGSNDGNGNVNGQIDNVRIWSTARTQIEIQNNMLATLDGDEPNLVTYYRFDQGTAGIINTGITTLPDRSQNQNDGTLANFDLGATDVNESNWVVSNAQRPIVYDATNITTSGFTANWQAVAGATDILIQVDDDPNFASPLLNDVSIGTGGTAVIVQSLNPGFYYYRIKADVGGTITNYSLSTEFTLPPGNALDFDGLNDVVVIPDAPSIDFGDNDFTIEFWMSTTSTGGDSRIITKHVCGSTNGWIIFLNNNGSLGFYQSGAGVGSNTIINDGAWHHIAATFDASSNIQSIYVDGLLDASVVGVNGVTSTAPLSIGAFAHANCGGPGNEPIDAKIDEVRIWSSTRNLSEIQNNMFSELLGNEMDLEAYYDFNQGIADGDNTSPAVNMLPDLTSNGNDGALTNFDDLTGSVSNWTVSEAFNPFDPTNLFTTEVSATRIDLSWTDNALNETGYTIERSDGNNDFTTPDATFAAAVDATSFSDNTVTAENGYYYRVIANGASGDSNQSNKKFGSTITPPGNALAFDGVDDFVDFGDVLDEVFTGADKSFTLESWIYLTAIGSTGEIILSKQGNSNCGVDERQFTFSVREDGILRLGYLGTLTLTSSRTIGGTTVLNLNEWYHVAATYDGAIDTNDGLDRVKLYVNGIEETTSVLTSIGPLPTELIDGPAHFAIGSNVNSAGAICVGADQIFSGEIDEVRIWDDLRSQSEIQNNMLSTVLGNESDLAAYYRFDQGTTGFPNPGINNLPDRSQNQNDGTLTNFDLGGADVDESNWVVSNAMMTDPEIAVYVGVGTAGAEITDAQVGEVDLGNSNQGSDLFFDITIENTGSADLNISNITSSTAEYSFVAAPSTVGIGLFSTFTIQLDGTNSGTFLSTITITSDDTDEATFTFPITGQIFAPEIEVLAGTDPFTSGDTETLTSSVQPNDATQTFTINNTGTADLTVDGALTDGTSYSVSSITSPLTAGGSTTFTVTLDGSADGTFTDVLTLTTNDADEGSFVINLSGTITATPVSEIEVLAGTDPFTSGDTETLTSSVQPNDATQTFTINNTGTADLTVSPALTDGSSYSVSSITSPLTAGGSTTFTVTLDGSADGTFTDVLTLTTNDADEGSFVINLSGTITPTPVPEIEVLAGTDPFTSGDTETLTSSVQPNDATQTFTINNTGTADLTISTATFSDGTSYSVTAITSPIVSGSSTTFTVTLDGSRDGTFNDVLTLTTNDADEGSFVINLSGTITATPVPEIEVLAGTDPFTSGDTETLTSSVQPNDATQTFTINNTGTADLTISTATFSDGTSYSVTAITSPIVSGSSTTFTVTLYGSTDGTFNDVLTLTTNDADEGSFVINLSGTITPTPVPEIEVLAGTDPFTSGDTETLTSSVQPNDATQTFTINNTGTADLTISTATFSDGTSYSATAITTPIASGGSTTFTVTLDGSTAGTFNDVLTLATNDADEGSFVINLAGTITAMSEAILQVEIGSSILSTEYLHVMETVIQTLNSEEHVTVRNTGNAELLILNASLATGTTFSISTIPSSIAPSNSIQFTITMDGSAYGAFSDILTLTTNSEVFVLNLTGSVSPQEVLMRDGTTVLSSESIVDFGQTPKNEALTKTFSIENPSSTASLNIIDISIDNDAFNILTLPSVIAPSSTDELVVELTAILTGSFIGEVTVESNFATFNFSLAGEVMPRNKIIDVYNVVTPNGDGKHDFLKIERITEHQGNIVSIFTRTGRLVYQAIDYDNVNVRFEGIATEGDREALPPGTYYYVIKLGTGDKDSGFIQLSR